MVKIYFILVQLRDQASNCFFFFYNQSQGLPGLPMLHFYALFYHKKKTKQATNGIGITGHPELNCSLHIYD